VNDFLARSRAAREAERPLQAVPAPPADAFDAPTPNGAGGTGIGYAGAALGREAHLVANAENGTRNHTLNRAAFNLGQLVAGGELTEQQVADVLAEAARAAGLGEHEIRATIASGLAKGQLNPRTPRAAGWSSIVDGTAVEPAELGKPGEPSRLDRLRAALVDTDGLDHIPEPQPLVPGVLYRDSLAWLYGTPGCGKSFVAIDVAGCVGTGQIWQGYGPAERGPVLYLVAEGVSGIKQRVRAWEHAMRQRMTGVLFLPVAVQAGNDADWQAFVDLVAELRPALVVVDTQARVTVGMEENSNTEMGILVHRVEQLRKASGACVLTIHHTGRSGEHMRGAIAIDGAATTTIKVEKDEDIVHLACTKQKDAPEFDSFRLRLVEYENSAVLSLIEGAMTVDIGQPAVRKLLVEWWNSHETDWVSVSTLIESKIVTKATFFRNAKALEKARVIDSKGEGNARRYRMVHMPAL
jgi:AAA domain